MSAYLIYGKRTGKKVDGEPVYDKTFRALNYRGIRVTKLSDAGTYATKEDAQEVATLIYDYLKNNISLEDAKAKVKVLTNKWKNIEEI